MAKREVTVVINGEEYVSKAADSADTAMSGFASKIPGWAKIVGGLTLAYQAVSAAISAAKDYVLESFAAYDKFAASQTKLAAQSKLTGVSLSELNRLADEGRRTFGLSTVTANDLATTVAKYASRAGEAAQANRLMAAALDLGAASGLNAAESMEALEQGLRGQDEGFDKLLGKNPSALWKEYADANGLAVGKMTDTQKRMAELTAVVEAGNIVQGAYNERMASGAGAQDRLNNSMEETQTAFGKALQPIRILVLEGLTALLNVTTPVIVGVAKLANFVGETFVGSFKLAQSAVGGVIMVVGKLTGSKDLEAWGERQSRAMDDYLDRLRKLEGSSSAATRSVNEHGRAHQLATVQVTASADAVKKHTETTEQQTARLNATLNRQLGEPMRVAIGLTEGAITRLGQAAVQQLPAEQAQRFLTHMQGLVVQADAARARMLGIKENTEGGAASSQSMAREVETVARGAIDAAGAFGVIDEKAQRSLNSAVNIASAVGEMAKSGFSFAGAVGVIGGVASLVNTMMGGDGDRKRLMRENNQRLAEVRDGLAEFNLEISGEDQSTLTDILSEGLADGPFTGSSQMPALLSWLKDKGFSENRLDKIAESLGINIRDKNGNIFYDGLVSLLTALMGTNQGPRKNFGNDLSALEDSFDVNDTDAAGQVQQLGNLGGQYSKLFEGIVDMNDLGGTRTRLRQLFKDFQDGKISLRDMGGMSRSQFQSFLTMLIGRVDQAIGSTGSAPAGAGNTGSTDVGTGGSNLVVGGGSSVSVETVQSVIKAMDTNLAGILTSHTAIHERIAVATESSAASLMSIDSKMDTLIAVTAAPEKADAMIEEQRYLLKVQQGGGASFR